MATQSNQVYPLLTEAPGAVAAAHSCRLEGAMVVAEKPAWRKSPTA